jgi:hypothetical protein
VSQQSTGRAQYRGTVPWLDDDAAPLRPWAPVIPKLGYRHDRIPEWKSSLIEEGFSNHVVSFCARRAVFVIASIC